jgi:plastocyanin
MRSTGRVALAAIAAAVIAACGGAADGGSEQGSGAGDAAPRTGAGAAGDALTGENLTPDPGGKVVEVQMLTDDAGNNVFEPKEVSANRGDVVRYVLKFGVHNVNFLADSNAVKTSLPTEPGPLLQLPGQTYDVKVAMPPGRYYFQCDPHALLGMIGHLTVTEMP